MAFTENLLFLGPSIAALITSAYAVRQGRANRAVDQQTSTIGIRMATTSAFLDAASACGKIGRGAEPEATDSALDDAARKVRMAFPGDADVSEAVNGMRGLALLLATHRRPQPLGDRKVLVELQNLADSEREERTPGRWTGAGEVLATVLAFRKDQEDAADIGKEPPSEDEFYSVFLMPKEHELGISLMAAALPMWRRAQYQERFDAHQRAYSELEEAKNRFVDVTGAKTHEPLPSAGIQLRQIAAAGPRPWRTQLRALTGRSAARE